MESLQIFNLVDNNGDLFVNGPRISIVGRRLIAVAHNIFIRCEIPEGGFRYEEIMGMSRRLGVEVAWLVEQLNQPRHWGVAGPVVAEMARLNREGVTENVIHVGVLRNGIHALQALGGLVWKSLMRVFRLTITAQPKN
jgi:hypothetical protein